MVAIGDVDELISVVVGGLVVVTTPGTVVDVGGGEDIDIVGITGVVGTTAQTKKIHGPNIKSQFRFMFTT